MLDLTTHWVGYVGLLIFVTAYTLAIAKESLHPHKSKPVVAADAGGAFSPFGDISTLTVWQKGMVPAAGNAAHVLSPRFF
jgi:hypothetical protein